MKLLPDIFSIINVSIFFILSSVIFAQEYSEKMDDKTLSPFFFVKSDDANTDQLPLKTTYGEINIAGSRTFGIDGKHFFCTDKLPVHRHRRDRYSVIRKPPGKERRSNS